jgi:hypothetical protein
MDRYNSRRKMMRALEPRARAGDARQHRERARSTLRCRKPAKALTPALSDYASHSNTPHIRPSDRFRVPDCGSRSPGTTRLGDQSWLSGVQDDPRRSCAHALATATMNGAVRLQRAPRIPVAASSAAWCASRKAWCASRKASNGRPAGYYRVDTDGGVQSARTPRPSGPAASERQFEQGTSSGVFCLTCGLRAETLE